MGKFHNILFIIVVAVVCFAILGNVAYSHIAETPDEPETSALEGRTLEYIPSFSFKSFQNREYQDLMEQALADKTPFRSQVLLENARVQRSLIALANAPFDYPAYSTFFGSEIVLCPTIGAVYQKPVLATEFDDKFFERAGSAAAKLVNDNSDLNWVYALPDRANITLASPAHDLVSNNVDYPHAVKKLTEELPESCTFVQYAFTDTKAFTEKYFKTDHHMQISGAIDFYSALVSALGKQPLEYDDPHVVADRFFGANARLGLVDTEFDDVWDVSYNTEGITVRIKSKTSDLKDADLTRVNNSVDETVAKEYRPEDQFSNVYAEWFTGDHPLIELTNGNPDVAGESLLLLGDSFDNNQMLLYAQHYEHVYAIDPRYYEESLQAFIDEHPDLTDAAFTLSLDNLNAFARQVKKWS